MNTPTPHRVHLIEVLTVVIGSAWGLFTWLDTLAQFGRPYGWGRLLLGGAMWVLAIGAVAWLMMYWKALKWRAPVPGILVIGVFMAMPFVADGASRKKEERFLAGVQPYLALLEQVRTGAVSPGTFPQESLPPGLSGCCLHVELSHDSAGTVGGIFVTEMAFGPKFAGWMYSEAAAAPVDITYIGDRFEVRKVTDRWYRLTQ